MKQDVSDPVQQRATSNRYFTKTGAFSLLEIMDKAAAGMIRGAGKALNKIGQTLEGRSAYIETFIPTTQCVALGAKKPIVDTNAYVSSTAAVVGDVNIGPGSSVWYGAVIRGT